MKYTSLKKHIAGLCLLVASGPLANATWVLDWNDNFDRFRGAKWTKANKIVRGSTYLRPGNVTYSNGKVHLKGDGVNGSAHGKNFINRGARITTQHENGSYKFTIGPGSRIDIRLKLVRTRGCNSAFWATGISTFPPALHFAELPYARSQSEGGGVKMGFLSNRGPESSRRQQVYYVPPSNKRPIENNYRTYRHDWFSGRYKAFYEGIKVLDYQATGVIPTQAHFLELGINVYELAGFTGTPAANFSTTMSADWIKVYDWQ